LSDQPLDRVRGFYEPALSDADLAILEQAREVRGLAQEAALLRTRLRRELQDQPEDFEALMAGVRLLVSVLLAQHRISGDQAETLVAAMATTFEHFADLLGGVDAAA
jgi:hypothetical protein